MSLQSYAFTIKCIKQNYFAERYELLFVHEQMLKRHKAIPIDLTEELDSMGRLHLHGVFTARKGLRYNLFKVPYYTIFILPLDTVRDEENWVRYIHKQEPISIEQAKVTKYYEDGNNHLED